MAKKKEENATVNTQEIKTKFQQKKETEHSGVSGDQRFFQGYES